MAQTAPALPARPRRGLPARGEADLPAEPWAGTLDEALSLDAEPPRWIGWRLRLLVGAVLTGCLGLYLLAVGLARQPHLDVHWRPTPGGQVVLAASSLPALQPHLGRTLSWIGGNQGRTWAADPLSLRESARWIASDPARARQAQALAWRAQALQGDEELPASVELGFEQTYPVYVELAPGGVGSLPGVFWLLGGLALVLYLVAAAVLLSGPSGLSVAYAITALAQCGNLVFMAVEAGQGLSASILPARWDWPARAAFDLATAAAVVQIAALHPHRLARGWMWVTLGWLLAAGLAIANAAGRLPQAWWAVQLGCTALGLLSLVLVSWSSRRQPHPYALVLRRFGAITLGTWVLLTLAVACTDQRPDLQFNVASVGAMIWYVFLASLLLLVPYLSRSQQVLREFSLLAATTTVATLLDLVFVAVFSLGQFASLTLSLFFALGAYLWAREWIVTHLLGSHRLTMERLFERLYRIARELETRPQRAGLLLTRLLRELFEPLEVWALRQGVDASRLVGNGSGLIVPVPHLPGAIEAGSDAAPRPAALLMRHARKGQHLFTADDARLTDRIVDQLRRAVAFDRAVEQGRSEERTRIAQDLHDDIGARLLTLMYQAPTRQMEDYIRYTLQDLKTLTRGLAAQSHRFADAAAEWKADLGQRLALAHCELVWKLDFDEDVELGMVAWSALTRVLRELVSNAIAHAQAKHVCVTITLQAGRLELSVADDGCGGDPQAWSHGLGLGGVRKRVKQLGGTVEWQAHKPRGVVCRVVVPQLVGGAADGELAGPAGEALPRH
ncbi:MAG: histidine kinase [Burkholderiales bacterium]|nr:histidine kinase [Burkholderiales bacterium]